MTPIHTILDQIRWDPRLSARDFELVWKDRSEGDVREPVSAFRARGEVPLHRIYQVWCDGEIVWDRATRLDKVGKLAARVGSYKPIRGAAFWNVECPEGERTAPVVRAVLALPAEIVGLAETSPELLQALRGALPPERTLLEIAAESTSHGTTGLAVLVPSDRAWQVTALPLPGRAALLATADEITVAVAHLTSDLRGDHARRRQEQLVALAAALPRQGTLIVLLDANTERELEELEALSLVEVDSGPTFEPGANERARSRTPGARKLDRVLVRGIPVQGGSVVKHTPALSDHWAVTASLGERAETDRFGRSAAMALSILPPETLVAALDALREGRDPAFGRWPPHLTLRHPFVASEHAEEAALYLARALAGAEPFELSFDGVGHFAHRDGHYTLWARPRPEAPLLALRAAIDERLPHLRDGRPFAPHLTLASSDRPQNAELERGLQGLPSFWVTALTVLERKDQVYVPVDTVPLGEAASLQQAIDETGLVEQDERWPEALERLQQALPGEISVIGGSAMGARLAGSDLDLVWKPEPSLADPLAAGLQYLAAWRPRRLDALHAPRLKLQVQGIEVDLLLGSHEGALEAERDVQRALAASDAQRAALLALKVWARRRGLEVPVSVGWLDLVLLAPSDQAPEAILLSLWRRLADPLDVTVMSGSAFRGAHPKDIERLRQEARAAAFLAETPPGGLPAWRAVFRAR